MLQRYVVALVLAVGMLQASAARAASITFESLDQGNGFFNVNVLFSFSPLEEQLDLGAFDFLVSFDPTAAALRSVTEGTFLRGEFDPVTQTWERETTFFSLADIAQDGSVLSPVQLVSVIHGPVPGATGSGLLASLFFEGTGGSGFTLTPQMFVDSGGNLLDVTFVPPTPPASVPEPSTLALLGLGLAALARKRLRRRSQPGT